MKTKSSHAIKLVAVLVALVGCIPRAAIAETTISSIQFPDSVQALSWSPNGTHLAVVGREDKFVDLVDLRGNELVWTVAKDGLNSRSFVAFDASGKLIITGSTSNAWPDNKEKTLTLIDADRGQVVAQLEAAVPSVHDRTNAPAAFSISSDASVMAVLLGTSSGKIAIYNTNSGQVSKYLQVKPPIDNSDLVIDADRHTVVFLHSDGTLDDIDYTTGKLVKQFNPVAADASAIALNPKDGSVIVAGSADYDNPEVLVNSWNPTSGEKLISFAGPSGAVTALAVSPDGHYVAASTRNTKSSVIVWDTTTGAQFKVFDFPGETGALSFSADGAKLAVAHGADVELITF